MKYTNKKLECTYMFFIMIFIPHLFPNNSKVISKTVLIHENYEISQMWDITRMQLRIQKLLNNS